MQNYVNIEVFFKFSKIHFFLIPAVLTIQQNTSRLLSPLN